MVRKSLLLFTALAGSLLLLSGCGKENGKPVEEPRPPLVLLFSVDTLRADHLSCYGYRRPTSPYIDRFAEDAVLFENALSQGAVTAPGHMSILTSLMPVVHRVRNPNPFDGSIVALAETIPTWALLMAEQGWMTRGLHGGGPVSAQFGFDRGFESYQDDFFWAFGTEYYSPERELETIRGYVRESLREEQPLFLFLHHYLCHDPYIKAPPDFNHRFLENPVPGLARTRADLAVTEGGRIDEESFWDGVDLDNPEHLEHLIALYDGSILYSDYIFGRLIEILKEEGIYEESLIILTSDHGEEFNEHGGKRHWKLFIENLHIPLIIKFPGGEFAGEKIADRARTLDLLPSVFEYLQFPISHHIQGLSFLGLLTGAGDYSPLIYSQALDFYSPDEVYPRESVRFLQGDYVYFNQLIPGKGEDPLESGQSEWLFNFAEDPREQINLIEQLPEIGGKMRSRAEKILREDRRLGEILSTDPGQAGRPGEELRRQLQSLGYIQ